LFLESLLQILDLHLVTALYPLYHGLGNFHLAAPLYFTVAIGTIRDLHIHQERIGF
jgi:hypothetical protein